jgi:hypothetical protein
MRSFCFYGKKGQTKSFLAMQSVTISIQHLQTCRLHLSSMHNVMHQRTMVHKHAGHEWLDDDAHECVLTKQAAVLRASYSLIKTEFKALAKASQHVEKDELLDILTECLDTLTPRIRYLDTSDDQGIAHLLEWVDYYERVLQESVQWIM